MRILGYGSAIALFQISAVLITRLFTDDTMFLGLAAIVTAAVFCVLDVLYRFPTVGRTGCSAMMAAGGVTVLLMSFQGQTQLQPIALVFLLGAIAMATYAVGPRMVMRDFVKKPETRLVAFLRSCPLGIALITDVVLANMRVKRAEYSAAA